MMEFAPIFADALPTAVYVAGSLANLAAFAVVAAWLLHAPRAPKRSKSRSPGPDLGLVPRLFRA